MNDPAAPWMQYSSARRWWFLALLFLVSLCNYIDRQVLSILIEPIKTEFGVSDKAMGLLTGLAFAIFYALLGLPVARIADRGNRARVIGISVALWSIMTMMCGAARTFPQLFLARMGVGIGEAGAIPPAQSLIADYFPPEQRARALAIFMASATFGYFFAFGFGSHIAAEHGWRAAFVAFGAPGVLLALIAWAGLDEPRLRLPAVAAAEREPFGQALRALAGKRSYVLLIVAMILYFIVAYGALTWFPAYMARVLKLDMAVSGPAFGAASAIGVVIGTVAGGLLADRAGRDDPRWRAWVPALALVAALPPHLVALASDSFSVFLAGAMIGGLALSCAVPAMFAALHSICGHRRRATAVAISFFFANLLGLGLGPLLTGAASDSLSAIYGTVGLRYAIMLALCVLLPGAAILYFVGRALPHDVER